MAMCNMKMAYLTMKIVVILMNGNEESNEEVIENNGSKWK